MSPAAERSTAGYAFFYSGLEAFVALGESRFLDVPGYLDMWQQHNCLEKLVKCGFYALVFEMLTYGEYRLCGLLDERESLLHRVMKLPRSMCAAIPRDISCDRLAFLQEYCAGTKNLDVKAALECIRLYIKEKRLLRYTCRRATGRMKKICAQVGEISRGNLRLVVPECAEEIEEEGKQLHHCVGSYIEAVADRTTLIFFLRKKTEPEKPFRTLEWNQRRFVQCQGVGNREKNGKEIRDFLEYARDRLLECLPEDDVA